MVGTGSGTYDFVVIKPTGRDILFFTASGIPTNSDKTDEYIFDWNAISSGGSGVTVRVDNNGDGIFEDTFTSDWQLTPSEYLTNTNSGGSGNPGGTGGSSGGTGKGATKVEICHNASKNNPHEITVAEPSLKAHLAHGDTIGKCQNSGSKTKWNNGKSKGKDNKSKS